MKQRSLHTWILAADLAWSPLALVSAGTLCHILQPAYPSRWPLPDFAACLVPSWLLWSLLSQRIQLDGFRNGWRLAAAVSHLLVAATLLIGALAAISYFSARHLAPYLFGCFGLMLLLGFIAIRWTVFIWLQRCHRNGHLDRVAILGSGPVAQRLALKLHRHPELFCTVAGLVCAETDVSGPFSGPDFPISVPTMEVTALLRSQQVTELALVHASNSPEVQNLAAHCREEGIRVSYVPQPYEPYLSRPNLLDLDGLFLLRLEAVTPSTFARIAKRCLDLALGSLLSAVTLPIVLICSMALRSSTGRGFRWESRVGWHGNEFSMLRLNVARDPAQDQPFQRMLWQLSISELPQFWNVLRGEMSLVGPRPEGPERARRYSPRQQQRLSAKPGMTGLAQVHGMREQHSSEEKTEFDLQYLMSPSLFMDVSLLIETVWTLSLRLARTLSPAIFRNSAEPGPYSSPRHLSAEVLQGAHRAQSGTD
jgi:lipopolysaccharide/colanic/teichoic acid biosynthesis glycosyltransferase